MGLARQIKRLRMKREESAAKKQQRRAFVEPLEPRILLSDLTTPGVAAVLDSGTDQTEALIEDFFSGETLLDTRVPFVVESKINPVDDFDILATVV